MAAVASTETVNVTINDIDIAVPKGELVVEAVKRLGLEIPIFCYHSRMKPVGMCRMCLVEVGQKQPDGSVRKMPKPQAACTLPVGEGMVVYTDTEMVHRDRKGVLEFLLINHPLDCPICDRGGECPLQNNTLFYGPSTSRYVELKRHLPKAFPLSEYVTLDLERCIQCGRCVRFTEEISGDSQLAFRFRGAQMQPSTFEMTTFESKFSGNVIEICPVGALTSTRYRFRARPWDLETKPGICTLCSNGCDVWMDYRGQKMVRINGRTNEAINEEWTCDRGKFGHDFYNAEDRPAVPLLREGDALRQTDWGRAYVEILRAFAAGGERVAALSGADHSNEDLFLLKRLFERDFGSRNLDYRLEAHRVADPGGPVDTIASFEHAPVILVFGTSLADEAPMLHLRIRKAWFKHGAKVIVAHSEATDAESFAHLNLRYRPGAEAALAQALAAPGDWSDERIATETGVPAARVREAAALLPGAKIVTTRSLYGAPGGAAAAQALRGIGASFNNYVLRANDQGATLLGVAAGGLDTHEILTACAEGKIEALWLAGADPLAEHPDRDLVTRALENVGFLVVQDYRPNLAIPYASVVLPACGPAEMDGTYTNMEGRVQRQRQVLVPRGEAKPAWRVYSELSLRLRPATPFFNASEVLREIATQVPAFAAVDEASLEGEGVLVA
jgi:NADH-quinone oxidoreductase subunit G